MPRQPRRRPHERPTPPPPADPVGPGANGAGSENGAPRTTGTPSFAQPEPTPDPDTFRIRTLSDAAAYRAIDELNREHTIFLLPLPSPRGGVDPRLTLEEVLGKRPQAIRTIQGNGQLVVHATGDYGCTKGSQTQNYVTDKMVSENDNESWVLTHSPIGA